jgi:hypothetical protein
MSSHSERLPNTNLRQPARRQNYPAAPRGLSRHDRLLSASSPSSVCTPHLAHGAFTLLHDSKKFREAKVRTQTDDEWFTRFLPFERFLHFLVVTSFLLLVITGMPLKFYYTDWAGDVQPLGNAEVAHTLHH